MRFFHSLAHLRTRAPVFYLFIADVRTFLPDSNPALFSVYQVFPVALFHYKQITLSLQRDDGNAGAFGKIAPELTDIDV